VFLSAETAGATCCHEENLFW